MKLESVQIYNYPELTPLLPGIQSLEAPEFFSTSNCPELYFLIFEFVQHHFLLPWAFFILMQSINYQEKPEFLTPFHVNLLFQNLVEANSSKWNKFLSHPCFRYCLLLLFSECLYVNFHS